MAKSFITDKLNIMTAFLNDDPDYISETLENQKYSKIVVILDTACPKYQETLIQVMTVLIIRIRFVKYVTASSLWVVINAICCVLIRFLYFIMFFCVKVYQVLLAPR